MSEPIRISIVGGHGQIARHLTRALTALGHQVRGLVRSADQFDDLRSDGAEPVLCDLEAAGPDELDRALSDSDVLVFAAGAGPDSGPDRKKSLDRDGAIGSLESAARVGARRALIISSMGADDPPDDDETFSVYLRAKHDADEAARAIAARTPLEVTIVRPGRLTDDDATGSIQLGDKVERSDIPRADVARVLAELIGSGHGAGQTFEVITGSTPIADAVRSLR